jgi:hypothetical protein
MRPTFASLLAIVVSASGAPAADRLDELFASWEKAQAGVQSLVVEFTLETKDVFDETKRAKGSFRLVRTPNGDVCACYELVPVDKAGGKVGRDNFLLKNRSVYSMDYDKKKAVHLATVDGDLQPFLERWFNPFVILLDRKRADAKCELKVVKQDEWYTYLTAKQKYPRTSVWEPTFQQCGIVFLNKATATVPRDMPLRLITNTGGSQTVFDIKSWRVNAPDGPKPEEFTKPENRPDWEVVEWPPMLPSK